MKGELSKKSTRTVYDEKVVRLQVDIPFEAIEEAEEDGQSLMEWLDLHVDREINFNLGPFEDDGQVALSSLAGEADGRS